MNKSDKIFIAGASGMVGSAIIRNLVKKGYDNLIGSTRTRMLDEHKNMPLKGIIRYAIQAAGNASQNNSFPSILNWFKVKQIFNEYLKFFIILLFFLFCSSIASSQNYYVDFTNGKDVNNGHSPDNAWQNFSEVKKKGEKEGFSAGDQILLKRGETWNERLFIYGKGIKGEHVIYGAYGIGENPLIKEGIYHRNYMHERAYFKPNEYITLENIDIRGAKAGIDVRTINNIKIHNIRIIECTIGIYIASVVGPLENWVLEDILISKSKRHGLFSYSDVNNMTVRRLETSYNQKDGAAFRTGLNNIVVDSIAHHNGEDGFDISGFYGTLSYIRCIARYNKSAGFSIKANGGGKATGNILYCISYNNFQGLEVGNESNSNTHNSIFYNNDRFGIDLENNYQQSITYEHSIKNCIIYNNAEKNPNEGFQAAYLKEGQKLEIVSNCYGSQSKERNIYLKKERRFLTLENWQKYAGKEFDSNSITANPMFSEPLTGNFTLKISSPCIDTGTQLLSKFKYGIDPVSSWVNSVQVLDQNLFGSGWEIGAFVYDQGMPGPPGTPSRARIDLGLESGDSVDP